MNDLKTIKAQNLLRLEQIAQAQHQAIELVLKLGDEGAYDKLRNAHELYKEFSEQSPVC